MHDFWDIEDVFGEREKLKRTIVPHGTHWPAKLAAIVSRRRSRVQGELRAGSD
jgi:hypothetical protein